MDTGTLWISTSDWRLVISLYELQNAYQHFAPLGKTEVIAVDVVELQESEDNLYLVIAVAVAEVRIYRL